MLGDTPLGRGSLADSIGLYGECQGVDEILI